MNVQLSQFAWFHHQEELPAGLQVLAVRGGAATVSMPGLWEARLTLVPAPEADTASAAVFCGGCC